jgi:two-component system, cell cycle sensor histidine kinase and response regulator CckA
MSGGEGETGGHRVGHPPDLRQATRSGDGGPRVGRPPATSGPDAEARFRSVFAESPVPQLLLDVPARTVAVNEAFAGLVGHRPDDLDGDLATLARLLAAPDVRPLDEELDRFLSAGTPTLQKATRLACREGRVVPVRLVVGRVDGTAPTPSVLSVLVEDLTRQQELEEQLVQAQKMEAIGRLAGGIAHDFNNLLTVISGYLELIEESLGPEHAVTEELSEVHAAADRARSLVEQLLTYSRRHVLEPVALDLGHLVHDLEGLLRRLLDERVQFVVDVPDASAPVLADPTRVQQVLVNLAVNAQDAMRSEGRLDVRVEPPSSDTGWNHPPELAPGRYARLRVHDTGAGMDATTLRRCFEPFFTTKGKNGGSGLGLSTAYGIAVQSGGTLSVRSSPGEGTDFTLWLPEPSGAVEPAQQAAASSGGLLLGSGMVLVAEDELSVRAFLRITLERAGYTVLAASDGEHALQLASTAGPFDMLVTDVVMPRLGGLALARRLMEELPGLRVLLVSGYPGDVALLEDMPPGVRLLAKPFGPDELTLAVRELLAGHGESEGTAR